jgi:hypothetical protein
MSKKPEVVFKVLGEGGGLFISRIIHNGQQAFLTNHQEMDFSDEGLDVNKQLGYSSFEEAFTYINKFQWYSLNIEVAHLDYRDFILNQLIERLGKDVHRPDKYLHDNIRQIEELLKVSIYKNQTGQWCYSIIDPRAATGWIKSNISFKNYQDYIKAKQDRFKLTLIDLLYISNFKGGNATINEPEDEINYKLRAYTSKFWQIEKEFYNKSLWELDSKEVKRLTDIVLEACDLTDNYPDTYIDGFRVSYLSALLNAYFPNLIPIIDRRLLINLQLVTDQDKTKQGQIKNIQMFYHQLIVKIANMSMDMGLSVREVDRKLFIIKI